ncbi:ABC transporter substrate-binding protein [Deinococcus yavapaiensis]|uniref:Iron complex transport system substrate-binding protein n=1 Tax=Deinococcus yavapaiensis KR-236 TaxID=694435 RepID=A0A318S7F5_9DEIO|nr:ABC transporter substrate-binding protein [Deinococcus yavapaiensis]PYE50961.1 iron complex transport system substrate-binding protein [Deinococcus yavapaiensis KR-236]
MFKRALPLTLALTVNATAAPITIKHDLGTTTLPGIPKRIVVIQEETAELLAVLGVKPVGFASTRVSNAKLGQPLTALTTPAAKQIGTPIYVRTHDQPSQEVILALKPDLILMNAGDDGSNSLYPALSKIAPTIAFDFSEGRTGWRKALTETARVFNKTTLANRYLVTYDTRVQTLRAQLASTFNGSNRTALLYMYQATDLMALGQRFSFSRALSALGMTLVMPSGLDSDRVFHVLSSEVLPTLKTDRIVLLRLTHNGQPLARNNLDVLMARTGAKITTYLLDPQEPSSGPITDLKRVEALANLLR